MICISWKWAKENKEGTDIQGAAEIVKHFKILVTYFSARVSRRAGI